MIRLVAAGALIAFLSISTPISSQPITATVGREANEPDGGGRTPIGVPRGTAAAEDEPVGPDTIDAAREIAKQGILGLLVVAILWSYRRDFFRKLDEAKAEKAQLQEVIEKSTEAITNSAVATARQTDATHRLARTVENVERRQAGLPPSVSQA